MDSIAERLQATQNKISDLVTKADRTSNEVRLVAVSKTQPASIIREAFMAGQSIFGENYVQEALNKQIELIDLPIEWHFIGPIQSNKTHLIAKHFDWVHGIDRLKIAERLDQARSSSDRQLQVCLQVNTSNEPTKSGVLPDDVMELAKAVAKLHHLKLRGLMTIPEPTSDEALQRERFRLLRNLLDEINRNGLFLDTLSMGMSDDYVIAIEEGATIVRIGSAIFGKRRPKSQV